MGETAMSFLSQLLAFKNLIISWMPSSAIWKYDTTTSAFTASPGTPFSVTIPSDITEIEITISTAARGSPCALSMAFAGSSFSGYSVVTGTGILTGAVESGSPILLVNNAATLSESSTVSLIRRGTSNVWDMDESGTQMIATAALKKILGAWSGVTLPGALTLFPNTASFSITVRVRYR